MILIENIIKVPQDCIVDMVIPKKDVFEAGELKTKDKKIFTDIVKQIKWCYKFSEDSVRVPKYIDDERKYHEVELFNVTLKYENVHKIGVGKFKEDEKIDKIAKILMRFIPYPLILVMQYEDELKFYGAHIRDNKADSSKIVIEDKIISTNWMDTSKLSEIEENFISKIQFENFDRTNFYSFYNTYIESIVQHDGAITAGGIVNLPVDEIKRIYDEISAVDLKIKEIEAQISEEHNYNRKVELNIEAEEYKNKKEKLISELKK